MKKILVFALLFIFALATKADDYYDIPAGWEKVLEFDSINGAPPFYAENNKVIYELNGWFYSNDFGKTFVQIDTKFSKRFRKVFIYRGKISYFDAIENSEFYFYTYDLDNESIDSVKVTDPIDGNIDKVYINEVDSTLIFKVLIARSNGDVQICFISRNGGESWEILDLFRYNKKI